MHRDPDSSCVRSYGQSMPDTDIYIYIHTDMCTCLPESKCQDHHVSNEPVLDIQCLGHNKAEQRLQVQTHRCLTRFDN